jgi:hypothetical protein
MYRDMKQEIINKLKRVLIFIWIIFSISVISTGIMGIIWGVRIHSTDCFVSSIILLISYFMVNLVVYYLLTKNKKNESVKKFN